MDRFYFSSVKQSDAKCTYLADIFWTDHHELQNHWLVCAIDYATLVFKEYQYGYRSDFEANLQHIRENNSDSPLTFSYFI